MGPQKCSPQTAYWCVQPFLHSEAKIKSRDRQTPQTSVTIVCISCIRRSLKSLLLATCVENPEAGPLYWIEYEEWYDNIAVSYTYFDSLVCGNQNRWLGGLALRLSAQGREFDVYSLLHFQLPGGGEAWWFEQLITDFHFVAVLGRLFTHCGGA